MFRKLSIYILFLSLYFPALAADLIETSAGANSVLVILMQLIIFSCAVIGFFLFVSSFYKYKKRKKSPTFISMQSVVVMFLGGLVLMLLGLLYYITGEFIFGPDYLSLFEPPDEEL